MLEIVVFVRSILSLIKSLKKEECVNERFRRFEVDDSSINYVADSYTFVETNRVGWSRDDRYYFLDRLAPPCKKININESKVLLTWRKTKFRAPRI